MLVGVGRVRRLEHEQRLDRVRQALRASRTLPTARSTSFSFSRRPAHEHRVEVAGLVRDVEHDRVLDETGLLHA